MPTPYPNSIGAGIALHFPDFPGNGAARQPFAPTLCKINPPPHSPFAIRHSPFRAPAS